MNTTTKKTSVKRRISLDATTTPSPRKIRLMLTLELEDDEEPAAVDDRDRHDSGDSGRASAPPSVEPLQPQTDDIAPDPVENDVQAEEPRAADAVAPAAAVQQLSICVACALGRCQKHQAAATPASAAADAAAEAVRSVVDAAADECAFRAGLIAGARRTSSETAADDCQAADVTQLSEPSTHDDDPRDWTVRTSELEVDTADTTIEWFVPSAGEDGDIASRVKVEAGE